MTNDLVELPLNFDGHLARVVALKHDDGGWNVHAEVDGRFMGGEQYPTWRLVEQFRDRMQQWLRQAEAVERRATHAA